MIDQLLSENLGIVRRAQLIAAGVEPQEIRRMLAGGSLGRLTHGWYATPTADRDVARAVRADGALTCLSALARLNVWVPTTQTLHVRRSRQHSGKKLPPGIKECQHRNKNAGRVSRPVDAIGQALLSALCCVDADEAVAIMDSILNKGLLSMADLITLLEHEPKSSRDLLRRVDERAESGTESLARCRLARLGIKTTPQAEIDGVGRVDLLIGHRLVLEIDSIAHHTSAENYQNDRARDLKLVGLGYLVVRLTYQDVIDKWDEVVQQILILVRARKHKCALLAR